MFTAPGHMSRHPANCMWNICKPSSRLECLQKKESHQPYKPPTKRPKLALKKINSMHHSDHKWGIINSDNDSDDTLTSSSSDSDNFRIFPDEHNPFEDDIGDLFHEFMSGQYLFNKKLFVQIRRYLVHDIWIPQGSSDKFTKTCDRIIKKLFNFVRPDGFWICYKHITDIPHIHFIHDCAYSNRSCRCTIINGIHSKFKSNRQSSRQTIRRGGTSSLKRYFENIRHYSNLEGHFKMGGSVGGQTWMDPDSGQESRKNATVKNVKEICGDRREPLRQQRLPTDNQHGYIDPVIGTLL